MAEEVNIRTEEPRPHYYGYEGFKRVSWPAIFAGTFVALGIALLFATFGLWIGFASWNPAEGGGGPMIWSVIWYLITAFFALFFGAWTTAKLAGFWDRGTVTLHGLVTWGVTMAAVFVLMGSVVGGLVSSVLQSPLTQTAAQAAGGPAQTAQAAAPQLGNVAGIMSRFWVTLFFGTLAGLIGAIAGAMAGRPKREVVAGEAAPEWRRAA